MIKANTSIITASGTFRAGQTVTGLSKTDIAWMGAAGYITETHEAKKEKAEKAARKDAETAPQKEVEADGL